MAQYISKAAVVAEIERIMAEEMSLFKECCKDGLDNTCSVVVYTRMKMFLSFLDTLEVKDEVDSSHPIKSMKEALRTEYEKGRADAIAEMQKHNDAIKPKFNVGDYIVSNSGLKYYITGIFKGYYMTESGCIITLDAQDNYKVYNNFWSKEEEELLNNICNLLQNPDSIKANQHVIGNIVDWLKSLKDRVQPKHEWSEEDEKNLRRAIRTTKVVYPEAADWLKSIGNRITWKPSKGQLECLGYAIDKAEKDYSPLANNRVYLTLKSLKEQLKKLIE